MIIHPSFYCPVADSDNTWCYTLRPERSTAAGVKHFCEKDQSTSVGALYLKESHVKSVSLFLQHFYDRNDNRTHYVWLGGEKEKLKRVKAGVNITWQTWLPNKKVNFKAEFLENSTLGPETFYCIAQNTSPLKSNILTWLPCSYRFRPLCSKEIGAVSHETIFQSVKSFMLGIKCEAYDPQDSLEKIKNLKERVRRGNLHGSFAFPLINLLFISIVTVGYVYVQYETGRAVEPAEKTEEKPTKKTKDKAETRVSMYEDLRSAFETYSHTYGNKN